MINRISALVTFAFQQFIVLFVPKSDLVLPGQLRQLRFPFSFQDASPTIHSPIFLFVIVVEVIRVRALPEGCVRLCGFKKAFEPARKNIGYALRKSTQISSY
jgi:hypothetical protein